MLKKKKLALSRETLRILAMGGLRQAAGGIISRFPTCSSPPNCNCTIDESGCGGGGENTCAASNCPSCPL